MIGPNDYRVIFLDIDGVLNSREWFAKRGSFDGRELDQIDPDAVARVQRIVDATDARIVVSSTWRLLHSLVDLRGWLQIKGLRGRIIGKTPEGSKHGYERGYEIHEWLTRAGLYPRKPSGIVILDDDSDMVHLAPWHVETSFTTGITDADVERAIATLQMPTPRVADPRRGVAHGS